MTLQQQDIPGSIFQQVTDLNTSFGFKSKPFNLVRDDVMRGKTDHLELKQALFMHYHLFITPIWNAFTSWREVQMENGNTLGLCGPIQSLKPLMSNSPDELRKVDRFALNQIRKRLQGPDNDYVTLIGEEKSADIRYGALQNLVELSWRVHIHIWERAHITGEERFISPYGVDLFAQCRRLLDREQKKLIMSIGAMQGLKRKEQKEEARRMAESTSQDTKLVPIIGEAIKVAFQTVRYMPAELRSAAIPRLASTHESLANITLNNLILEARKYPDRKIETLLQGAIARVQQPANRAEVLRKVAAGQQLKNSSQDGIVCGCPAMGTPAFAGIINLYQELSERFKLDPEL